MKNEIGSVRYLSAEELGGYPAMLVEVDGIDVAFVKGAVKLTLLALGVVVLGEGFEDRGYTVTIPASEAEGRPETVIDAATDDPELVELVRQYLET